MKNIIKLVLGASLVIGLLPLASANALIQSSNVDVGGDGEIFPFAAGETALVTWNADDTVIIKVNGAQIGGVRPTEGSLVLAGDDFPKPNRAENPGASNTNNLGQVLNKETLWNVTIEIIETGTLDTDTFYVDVSRGYEVTDVNQRTATLSQKGAQFAKIVNGGCSFTVKKVGLFADCREGGDRARVLYRLGLPALGAGEFVTGHSLSTVIWDGGDASTHTEGTLNGGKRVRVNLHQDFLGQIRKVVVTWSIDAPDTLVEV